MSVLYIAIDQWLDRDDGARLADLIEHTLSTLRDELIDSAQGW